ncbi:hypothetical protein [Bradyrhizobium sp. STM 3561]|uniref:hypothetical protein n=1 Tax=Bradyrhizobium sp. STM 3561 TaxID=578923 RepID=UPI00388F2B0D
MRAHTSIGRSSSYASVVFLKVADIDSRWMVIWVEQGKGGRDRYVMLLQLLKSLEGLLVANPTDTLAVSRPRR